MTNFFRAGLLGDLKVSGGYFMPVMMSNAEQEYLTYPVQAEVSVRRGQSAIVPIIDAQVDCEALCVYNSSKMPNHPLLVWSLFNTSGVALEQGPVTILHTTSYLGEGLIRFTGVGDELQIPYALEFGILVREDMQTLPPSLINITFDPTTRQAVLQQYMAQESTYELINRVARDITVQIERRDKPDAEYFDTPDSVSQTQGHTRWAVNIPAREAVTFIIRERTTTTHQDDPTKWTSRRVEDLRVALSDTKYNIFNQLFEERRLAALAAEQAKTRQAEYDQVVARQDQLRKNLGTLGDSERELAIRNRILDDLEASENRRRVLETEIGDLNTEVKERQTNQTTLINQLFSNAP